MSEHGERLREAFDTQQDRIPDPAAVYARVLELSGRYRRRRRGLRVAGGSALAAGAIAAGVQLPALLPGGGGPAGSGGYHGTVVAGTPSPSSSADRQQRALDAYAAAGYGHADAQELARLWHADAGDLVVVKAEAGAKLLAGQTLPIKPSPDDDTGAADPGRAATLREGAIVDAFFTSGYDQADAVQLARIWNLDDPYRAKVRAGTDLLAGKKLPITAHPADGLSRAERTRALQADTFFAAGYDYDDAVALRKIWHAATPYDAKVLAGKKLMAGQSLPIKP